MSQTYPVDWKRSVLAMRMPEGTGPGRMIPFEDGHQLQEAFMRAGLEPKPPRDQAMRSKDELEQDEGCFSPLSLDDDFSESPEEGGEEDAKRAISEVNGELGIAFRLVAQKLSKWPRI